MTVYADPSFLVSLYGNDSHSIAAALEMRSASAEVFVSSFGELEVVNAIGCRVFRKEASSKEAGSALQAFQNDLTRGVFHVCPLTDSAIARAVKISLETAAKLGTRTADLLHVALALDLKLDCLYSFDAKQRKLAHHLHLRLNQLTVV